MKCIAVNGLNKVYMNEEVKHNGVHNFEIRNEEEVLVKINYQEGPRNVAGSIAGVLDEDLLTIVKERMETFQKGEYACKENEMVLQKVEEAIMWSRKRTEDRKQRGVLGTYNK